MARARSPIDVLTETELTVARLYAKGYDRGEIAETIDKSANTVSNQIKSIYEKLGIKKNVELAACLDELW